MTDMASDLADERVIEPDDDRYNARLVRRDDQHASLGYFWVRFDGDPTPFDPGQYMTIGVFVDGKIVQRPYSVASAPATAGADGYELYIRLVQGGTFTPLLWRLPVGGRMRMIGPKGKFVLEPDDDRIHLFISSGTGNAPFVAMMRQALVDGRPRRAVFLNGVSYESDLGYRGLLEGWESSGEYPVQYIPTVSRPGPCVQHRLDRTHGSGRIDRRSGVRGTRTDRVEHDRLPVRQPRHDPRGRVDPARARLPRAVGQEGAVLAEGQGTAGCHRGRGRRQRRRVTRGI